LNIEGHLMQFTRHIGSLFLMAMMLLAACGGDDSASVGQEYDVGEVLDSAQADVGDEVQPDSGLPDVSSPLQPTTVETDLLSTVVAAGDLVVVTCRLLDQYGEDIDSRGLDFSIVYTPPDSFDLTGPDVIATRAGRAGVQCGLGLYGIVDNTPATLEILPGAPHTVVTTVDEYHIQAGEDVSATCEVIDAFGNPVLDAEPVLQATPSDRTTISDSKIRIEIAGIYDIACHVDGAQVEEFKQVEVTPSLPASLAIAVVPNQQVYAIGQVVEIAYVVTDEFGNVIPAADVSITSSPAGQPFGTGRFRYAAEGTYTITVRVNGATSGGVTLKETATIVINSDGPAIECGTPVDGGMIDVAVGSQVNFSGTVADASGVTNVKVNGLAVPVNPDGSFSSAINVTWGINFVELVATDAFGEENTRFCAFLASDDWKAEGPSSHLDNGVLLRLNPASIDDGNRADIDSLADILDRVLNATELRDQLHSSMLAANPLKPSTCDTKVLGVCLFRSEVIYLDTQIDGPNTTTLSLVNGGLRVQARVKNVRVRVRIKGHISGIPYDTTGWVTVSSLDVDMIIDLTSSAGRPKATVRSTSTSVGSVSTSFNGIDGAIVNVVVSLFNGSVRNLIRDSIQDFVRNNFNGILDGVFSSLDISSFGTTFAVPRLEGNGQVTLDFGTNLTGLSVNTSRARFGIGTRIRPQVVSVALPSLGTPLPPQALDVEPAGSQPVIVAIYVAVLNQALHSLWRGGFLNTTLGSQFSGGAGLPSGLRADIEGLLPPVVENIAGNKVRLMLGGLRLNLIYPGLFDAGLPMTLGATATTDVSVQNGTLQFGVITIENLYFSTNAVSLDANTRSIVESFLNGLVQGIVNASLNNALPSLPIPSFTLPASLSAYGLPANGKMTISPTSTVQTSSQYILRGNFAIQ